MSAGIGTSGSHDAAHAGEPHVQGAIGGCCDDDVDDGSLLTVVVGATAPVPRGWAEEVEAVAAEGGGGGGAKPNP